MKIINFGKSKWLKEHLALIIFVVILNIIALILAGIFHRPEFIAGISLIIIIEYIFSEIE